MELWHNAQQAVWLQTKEELLALTGTKNECRKTANQRHHNEGRRRSDDDEQRGPLASYVTKRADEWKEKCIYWPHNARSLHFEGCGPITRMHTTVDQFIQNGHFPHLNLNILETFCVTNTDCLKEVRYGRWCKLFVASAIKMTLPEMGTFCHCERKNVSHAVSVAIPWHK